MPYIQWIQSVFNIKVLKYNIRRMRRFFAFSLPGMMYYFMLKIKGKTIVISGRCKGCGSCCTSLSLESKVGWLRYEQDFRDIVTLFPQYNRFEITGLDPSGFLLFRCTWCTPQGTCLYYDKRLPLCKKFPEKTLPFAGGTLPVSCGYSFDVVTPFENILKKEIKRKK